MEQLHSISNLQEAMFDLDLPKRCVRSLVPLFVTVFLSECNRLPSYVPSRIVLLISSALKLFLSMLICSSA